MKTSMRLNGPLLFTKLLIVSLTIIAGCKVGDARSDSDTIQVSVLLAEKAHPSQIEYFSKFTSKRISRSQNLWMLSIPSEKKKDIFNRAGQDSMVVEIKEVESSKTPNADSTNKNTKSGKSSPAKNN